MGSASERSEREEPLRFIGRTPSERSASAGEETPLVIGRPNSGTSSVSQSGRSASGDRPVRSFQEAQRPLRSFGRSASGRSASGSSASGDRPLRSFGRSPADRERPLRSFGRAASDRSASGEEPVLSEDGQLRSSKANDLRDMQAREYRIE